ncbi:MAG: YaeQ family protein, partial [Pseudohongiella sp.]|nr:YaeQ family protein [Pseudohongiella sp.]
FERQKNLKIYNLANEETQALAQLAQRTMQLQVIIQDGQVTLSDDRNSVTLNPQLVFGAL